MASDLQTTPVATTAAPADLRQLVASGDVRCVLGFSDSRQYIDAVSQLTRIPRSPAWLLGAFSADGLAVPLIDIGAWALGQQPMPWQLAIDTGEQLPTTYRSNTAGLAPLRALRLGDGASTWAIRLSHSPSVVDMRSGTAKPVDNHLPLAVSGANGRLMAHAELAWFLGDGTTALQVRWDALAQTLKTELSGASLQ